MTTGSKEPSEIEEFKLTEIDNCFFNTDNNYDKDQDNDCDELE